MVVLYKDRKGSLIYDYSAKMFKVITLNGKYEVPVEAIVNSVEGGSLKGARKSFLSFDKEKEVFLLSLKSVPKEEGRFREELKNYDAKVAVNGTVKKLDVPGLISLVRKKGVPRERERIFLNRVIYCLIEKYYRNGDIPSLKSVKKIVEDLCEIERTIRKAKEVVKNTQLEENQDCENGNNKDSNRTISRNML